MLELNSMDFLRAATALARFNQVLSAVTPDKDEVLLPASVANMVSVIGELRREADGVGAKLAVKRIDRFLPLLQAEPCSVTLTQSFTAMNEIESRFADYLEDVKMFALVPQEAIFMQAADALVEREGFAVLFPNASFELEEGSKCLALGRYTAAVFHSMRMLEYGIKALAKRLGIEDPTKAVEKNWGIILGSIQGKIDELWPRQSRLPNSEGAQFEALHAHLETVRNPWRNATMHVETIYVSHEALHIVRCAAFFMVNLSKLIDEKGNPVEQENPLQLPSSDEGQHNDKAGGN